MRTILILSVLWCGCYHTVDVVGGDTGDGGPDAPVDGGGVSSYRDAPFDAGMLPRMCGGVACAEGQICCVLDGRCVDVGDPSCVVPETESDPDACATSADCPAGRICSVIRTEGLSPSHCSGGVGRCAVIPEGCFGSGPVCGCDGRTYPSTCVANALGVNVGWEAACGVGTPTGGMGCAPGDSSCGEHGTCDAAALECVWEDPIVACGSDDAHCPAGQDCCEITGVCHDPSVPGTCALPPEGTLFPCASDDECARYDGSWWHIFTESRYFCDAPSCSGPGGCRWVPGSCEGVLSPVCGCDGVTYQNECEAQRARVRVASEGACE